MGLAGVAEMGSAADWLPTILAGGLGAVTFWAAWLRGPPASYPGDPVPIEKRLGGRVAHFRAGTRKAPQVGWKPRAETQPGGDILPHNVAGQQVWDPPVSNGNSAGSASSNGGVDEEVLPFDPADNPNASDRIFRAARLRTWTGARPAPAEKPAGPLDAARRGFAFYQMLQCDDGQWAGDYGGPHFLLPGFVIAAYIVGRQRVFSEAYLRAIEAYLRNHQQADGGWGTHIESPSTMFGSVLNYTALRLVGVAVDDPACVEARNFLSKHGGALYAPSWAKFWLAVLGVYEWEGIAPVPPEMWLLPQWFPLHPGRFWCHCRMVYLPMCYLYARRFAYNAAADPVTASLRRELYNENYGDIRWGDYMHSVADIDNYSPINWVMRLLQNVLCLYERWGPCRFLRDMSSRFAEEYMHAEDVETNYLTIGPVSKALHMVVSWVAAGGQEKPDEAAQSKAFLAHVARVPAYLWVAEDGMKVQGYNGSMAWDTSFAVQACAEAKLQDEFPEMCAKACGFLAREQVRALPEGDWRHWRQPIRGGWGFSTAEQAWPVSDTTAEAFKAVLCLRGEKCLASAPSLPDDHLFDTVQFLLSYQNGDGGWATYENCRGWKWYELLNPSEVFGDIMIDYSYVECSASAMGALVLFSRQFPQHRSREIAQAVQRGAQFIKTMQRRDGSWYGCWGCCFTYGCWFGIEGLLLAGERPGDCPEIKSCVSFLLSKQNADGGWGEDFASCFDREYASRKKLYGCEAGSTVVQSAWALLAIMAGDCEDTAAVRRGIDFLMHRQLPSGDWPQENVAGVFNRSVGITYTAFRNVFPLWALGRYARDYAPRHGLAEEEGKQ